MNSTIFFFFLVECSRRVDHTSDWVILWFIHQSFVLCVIATRGCSLTLSHLISPQKNVDTKGLIFDPLEN